MTIESVRNDDIPIAKGQFRKFLGDPIADPVNAKADPFRKDPSPTRFSSYFPP